MRAPQAIPNYPRPRRPLSHFDSSPLRPALSQPRALNHQRGEATAMAQRQQRLTQQEQDDAEAWLLSNQAWVPEAVQRAIAAGLEVAELDGDGNTETGSQAST